MEIEIRIAKIGPKGMLDIPSALDPSLESKGLEHRLAERIENFDILDKGKQINHNLLTS